MYEATRQRIGEIIGEASMCWSETPKGVFNSERAAELVDEIMTHIQYPLEHPDDKKNNPMNQSISEELESISEELMEELAAIEHERWSKWHKWVRANWTGENIARWDRQSETPYSALSESEKESDRREVRSYLPLLESKISQAITADRKENEKLKELLELQTRLRDKDIEELLKLKAERKELRELLMEADSKLSLLRHRGGIRWGSVGMCDSQEVDAVIGKLRSKYESLLEEK